MSAVFGYESRELESDYRPDASAQAADRTGAGGPIVALAGGYDVKEYFLELGIPVTDNFNLEVGARFADYSTDNDTDAFKFGVIGRLMTKYLQELIKQLHVTVESLNCTEAKVQV